ncbi:MAG: hypothetical protein ACTSRZ_17015 [Promethearchaeota archaeon]
MKQKNLNIVFIILFFIIPITQIISSCLDNYRYITKPSSSLAGTWAWGPKMIYAQHLGEGSGICVLGVSSLEGQPNRTDVVLAGCKGWGSYRSLVGYHSNTSTGYPCMRSQNSDIVSDTVKFVDGSNNVVVMYAEQELIYGENRIVRQRCVNPPLNGDKELIPDWFLTTTAGVESIVLGNLDGDSSPEVAALCKDGKVYGINNLGIAAAWIVDLNYNYDSYYKQVKNTINVIDNLDQDGLTWQDVIVGHHHNVTAISTNNSHDIIWNTDVGSIVASVTAVPDQNGDGKQEVVASAFSGLFLLNGADGTILTQLTNVGTYFREVLPFNDTAVISGNHEGYIYIWDINPFSPTFGTILHNITLNGDRILSLLNIGDLDEDGIDEFAVGGYGCVGVLYGNNITWRWRANADGASYWHPADSIYVYDICLMEDLDGDGANDIAVTGNYDEQTGAIFMYSSKGAYNFIPDLSGTGSVDSLCNIVSHNFVFTATAYQAKGLPVAVKVIIDDNEYDMQQEAGTPNWQAGVSFTYQTTLTEGKHTFKFNFTDTNNDSIIYDPDKTITVGDQCIENGDDIDGFPLVIIISSLSIGLIYLFYLTKRKIK